MTARVIFLVGILGWLAALGAPQVVVSGVHPSSLTAKDGRIVWVEDSVEGSGDPHRLFCVAPDVPLGHVIQTSTTAGRFADVQFDAQSVWFFRRGLGSLGNAWYNGALADNGLPGRGVTDATSSGHVLLANNTLYFADANGVQQLANDHRTTTVLSRAPEDRNIRSPWLTGNAQFLFWFTGPESARTLRRMPLQPVGPPVPVAVGIQEPRWLRESGNEVFWANTRRQIWARGNSLETPRLVATAAPGFDISGLVVTATHVYWSQKLASGPIVDHPTLMRTTREGGAPEVVAIGRNAEKLMRDGSYIYWAEREAIWRMQLDTGFPFAPDFAITGMEVTQGIQNLANEVPLVPDKATLVRLFVTEERVPGARLRTSAVLHGTRDGVALPGSPLRSTQPFVTIQNGQPLSRADMTGSFLFIIPPAWRHGSVVLRAELNPDHLLPESTYDNNSTTRTLSFLNKGGLCVAVTPVSTSGDAPLYGIERPGFRDLIRRFESLYPIAQADLVYEPSPMRRFGGPYTMPDDGSILVFDVFARYVFSSVGSRCPPNRRLHWMAMVDPAANTDGPDGTELGRGALWTVASWVKMVSDRPPETGFGSPSGAHTMAQELGHNLNGVLGARWLHVDCGGPEGLNHDYPYPPMTIGPAGATGYWGFDPISMLPIAPDSARDFMSYCSPVWTSDYNWRGLIDELPDLPSRSAAAPAVKRLGAPSSELVLFGGTISAGGKLESIEPAYVLPSGFVAPGSLETVLKQQAQFTGPDSTHVLEFLDAKGHLLAAQPFSPVSGGEHGSGRESALIALLIPFPQGSASIVVRHGKESIGAIPVSASAPQLKITAPKAGSVIKDKLLIEWAGSDPDGDAVRYTLEYSPDGGSSWLLLAQNILATQWELGTAQLPGGKVALVRVLATDGINTTIATSEAFRTPDQPPVVWLDDPRPGTRFVADELIWLRGAAYDPETGMLPDENLVWSIDGLGEVGRGRDLSLPSLPPGRYQASLTGHDLQGSVTRSVEFTVANSQPPIVGPVTIRCPKDMEVPCSGNAGTIVTYALPDVMGAPGNAVLVCKPPSGSAFQVGSTVVACRVVDPEGAELAVCQFTVHVRDTKPPAITCPPSITTAATSIKGAVVNYAVQVKDDCDSQPKIAIRPPSGSLFPVGTTEVICSASDAAGNQSECRFQVTVMPVRGDCLKFTCPADILVACQSPSGTQVNYPLPTGTNQCSKESILWTCDPKPGLFPPGTTTVRCWGPVLDSGEAAYCEFKVTVEGQCPPRPACLVLQCPDELKVPCQGPRGSVVHFDFVARNECGTELVTFTEPLSGSVFPPGTNEVTCTAIGSGMTNQCRFIVVVGDDCAPGLAVRKSGGGSLVLAWPVSAVGYVPQEASGLELGEDSWHRVTEGILRVDDENQVTIPVGASGAQFYRLLRPLELRTPFPKPARSLVDPARSRPQQVLIKFQEGCHIREREGALRFDPATLTPQDEALLRRAGLTRTQVAADVREVGDLIARRTGARLFRVFENVSESSLALRKSSGEVQSGEELADLDLYYEIFDPTADATTATELIRALNNLASVEIAYAQPIVSQPDVDLPPSSRDLNLAPVQNYLDPAPTGIDARAAWSFPGGRGGRSRVIDIESGWHLDSASW